ncbi:MAG: low molecular weight phosphotyrosine protein phosphatase [Sphingobium sp.]|nr:low molecular weight phosphotyrosine protein phosphatase [Sphingobium sp.]
MTDSRPVSVLFLCLGNICRSPLAEAAFRSEAGIAGLDVLVDSAGTSNWHIGKAPDKRAQAEALRHGVDISRYAARQAVPEDFTRFTHIFALDGNNLSDLEAIAPNEHDAHLSLLMDMVPGREGTGVNDPYYGGPEDFEETWADVSAAAQALVRRLIG